MTCTNRYCPKDDLANVLGHDALGHPLRLMLGKAGIGTPKGLTEAVSTPDGRDRLRDLRTIGDVSMGRLLAAGGVVQPLR